MGWSSPPRSGHNSTRRMYAGRSGQSAGERASARSGRRANCGTHLSLCCRTTGWRSSRSAASWGTVHRMLLRRSIATRSGQLSPPGPRRWTGSSPSSDLPVAGRGGIGSPETPSLPEPLRSARPHAVFAVGHEVQAHPDEGVASRYNRPRRLRQARRAARRGRSRGAAASGPDPLECRSVPPMRRLSAHSCRCERLALTDAYA